MYSLMKRSKQTIWIFFETSHGKSKSDGLGGVVKWYVSKDVAAKGVIIRNGNELFDYCDSNLAVENQNSKMMQRKFFYISVKDMNDFRESFPRENCGKVAGIRKIHQVLTNPGSAGIYLHQFACMCKDCMNNNIETCNYSNENPVFANGQDAIKPRCHLFINEEIDFDIDEDEAYVESFATAAIKKADIAIIRAGDNHLYYLGVLVSDIYETKELEKDDYHHEVPANQRVMKCNYLELFRENKDGDVYYVEEKKVAKISAYCIAGICPDLMFCKEKRRGKMINMLKVTNIRVA